MSGPRLPGYDSARCGAPKERGREGVCNRKTKTAYCPEHLPYLDDEHTHRIVLDDGRVVVVYAESLDQAKRFISDEHAIKHLW